VSDTDDRIRERAYRIWLDEGRPEGRAEAHWEMAAELVAIEDEANQASMLKPNPLQPGEETIANSELVEPLEVMENLGEFPTLTDQGEELTVPKVQRAKPAKSVAKATGAPAAMSAPAKASASKIAAKKNGSAAPTKPAAKPSPAPKA
jgi:hypothetical protein